MDSALIKLREAVCLAGPQGLSCEGFFFEAKRCLRLRDTELSLPPGKHQSKLTDLLAKRIFPSLGSEGAFQIGRLDAKQTHFAKNQTLRLNVPLSPTPLAEDFFPFTKDSQDIRFYCADRNMRRRILFNHRHLVAVGEGSFLALEMIASHGQRGVTQAELAKILGCDPKSMFHWLKSLMAADLITRLPVASCKTFTYLLILSRFIDEEELAPDGGNSSIRHNPSAGFSIASHDICQRIVEALAKAPARTLPTSELFASCQLQTSAVKAFRRAALRLCEAGWLETLFDDELGSRLFRLKRTESDSLDFSRLLRPQGPPRVPATVKSIFFPEVVPLIGQVIACISRAYPDGLSTTQLCLQLGLGRKYAYKLLERLATIDGIVKVADFVGKEKQLRFFCKDVGMRDRFFAMFDLSATEQPFIPIPAQSPLIPQTTSSPVATKSEPTASKQRRNEVLLAELEEHRILEVGKELTGRIQLILDPDSQYTMDIKTLRRSVDSLADAGRLHKLIVMVPHGTGNLSRTLIIHSGLSPQSQTVRDFIEALQDPSKRQAAKRAKVEYVSVPLSKDALTTFGFVFGPMARARLLHSHLLSSTGSDRVFDAKEACFEELSLDLFLKLVGCTKMSRNLFDALGKLNTTRLRDLPKPFSDEIDEWKKRHAVQILLLLQILTELRLIDPIPNADNETQLSKLLMSYRLLLEAPLFDPDTGLATGEVKVQSPADADAYWRRLRSLVRAPTHSFRPAHLTSVYDENALLSVPRAFQLARCPESWKIKLVRDRQLLTRIRKTATDLLAFEKAYERRSGTAVPVEEMNTASLLKSLAEELEEPPEQIEEMITAAKEDLLQKQEAKRSHMVSTADSDIDMEAGHAPEGNEAQQLALSPLWSAEDESRLPLIFALLTSEPFAPASAAYIPWNVAASSIFSPPKDPIILRRHGLKLCRSAADLEQIVWLSAAVRLVLGRNPELTRPWNSDLELQDRFKAAYDSCCSVIEEATELDALLDHFLYNEHPGTVTVDSAREKFLCTFESWTLPRSFRQSCLLNDRALFPGIHDASFNPFSELSDEETKAVLALRRVLVSVHVSPEFDHQTAVSFLSSQTTSDTLQTAVDFLTSSGFASILTSKRSHYRQLGFPWGLSEACRSVFDGHGGLELEVIKSLPLTVSCSDTVPGLNDAGYEGLAAVADALLQRKLVLEPVVADDSVRVKLESDEDLEQKERDLDPASNPSFINPSFMWMRLDESSANDNVIRRLFSHLTNLTKNRPGQSKTQIQQLVWPLLTPQELDCILEHLSRCKILVDSGPGMFFHHK